MLFPGVWNLNNRLYIDYTKTSSTNCRLDRIRLWTKADQAPYPDDLWGVELVTSLSGVVQGTDVSLSYSLSPGIVDPNWVWDYQYPAVFDNS